MAASLSFGERVARSAWRVTPQRALSQVIGWGARRRLPAALRGPFLRSFARRYGIDVSEAEKTIDEYTGVQEFFTRRLRPGARPVDRTAGVVVGPADGTLIEQGTIREGQLFHAKGASFTVADLLADADLARSLDGGAFHVTYLAPHNYHRVHAPAAGRILAWRHIPGTLFPVNRRSVAREPGLFAKNERFVTVVDGEAGLYALVMVAAVGVGHVTASYDPEVATHAGGFANGSVRHRRFDVPLPLERGGEVGVFNLGSTTIVVFQRDRVVLDGAAPGASVRMGRALGRIVGEPRQSARA